MEKQPIYSTHFCNDDLRLWRFERASGLPLGYFARHNARPKWAVFAVVLLLLLFASSIRAASYGDAVAQMRNGAKMTRTTWAEQFVYLLPGASISVTRPPLLYIFGYGQHIHQMPRFEVCEGTPPQSIICRVYVPTLDDMFANDWQALP